MSRLFDEGEEKRRKKKVLLTDLTRHQRGMWDSFLSDEVSLKLGRG